MKLPDISSGFMRHGIGVDNEWITEIQSRLTVGNREAYLAHECIHERVVDGTRAEGRSRIFDSPWLTAVVHSWNGTHLLHIGHATIKAWPFRQGTRRQRNYQSDKGRPYSDIWHSEVHAPPVDVQALTFAEAMRDMHGPVGMRNLYFQARFTKDGEPWSITAPCRYINYSAGRDEYYQVISGLVLYRKDDFRFAYVSFSVTESGCHLEICYNAFTNVFLGQNIGLRGKLGNALTKIPVVGRWFVTEEFCEVDVFEDASVDLFYSEALADNSAG
ncbi:MAG: hypothetical protein GKS00_21885 [Alphaproteobacteria bacterium]|nr:hypothetical protein [Alphaproteobacteria bacterium]